MDELSVSVNQGACAIIRSIINTRGIAQIGVNQRNPDFLKLADAFDCPGIKVNGKDELEELLINALKFNEPTLILVQENDYWLMNYQNP